ncbi:1002_t:CDS:2 [Acaulospora colombiana]|uniref:1002_t:CDS:1 n=1 Tax=Acaulospora colombiana TaxID=27376 RepID=A0ACA9KJ83_9GLOM|nr:1002_t:CDS:2 [Acaulospora colombiana]
MDVNMKNNRMSKIIKEEICFSSNKLTEEDDIRSDSLANLNRPKVWAMPEYEYALSSAIEEDNITNEKKKIDGNSASDNSKKKKNRDRIISFVRWKFRFEWVPDQEFPPWWESSCERLLYSKILPGKLKSFVCPECRLPSNMIYEGVWICLNHNCQHFWQSLTAQYKWEEVPKNLNYVKAFLNPGLIEKDQAIKIPFSILPPQPPTGLNEKEDSPITVSRKVTPDGAIVFQYSFPEGGHVIHRLGNLSINSMSDKLFLEFQDKDIPFKRNKVKNGNQIVGSELLARQFSLNIGKDYEFSLAVETLQFEQCPEVVHKTYLYLIEMCAQLVPGAQFNEMLLVAYLNDQRDNFFNAIIDDGEKGVAPIVGNLSLGASAKLMFRRKKKASEIQKFRASASTQIGSENTSFVNDDEVAVGRENSDCLQTVLESHEDNMSSMVPNDDSFSSDTSSTSTTPSTNIDSEQVVASISKVKLRSRKRVISTNSTSPTDSITSSSPHPPKRSRSRKKEAPNSPKPTDPSSSSSSTSSVTSNSDTLAEISLPTISTLGIEVEGSNISTIPRTPLTMSPEPFNGLPVDHMNLNLKVRGSGPDLVLKLNHGDVLLMVGKEIQKYYEQ